MSASEQRRISREKMLRNQFRSDHASFSYVVTCITARSREQSGENVGSLFQQIRKKTQKFFFELRSGEKQEKLQQFEIALTTMRNVENVQQIDQLFSSYFSVVRDRVSKIWGFSVKPTLKSKISCTRSVTILLYLQIL